MASKKSKKVLIVTSSGGGGLLQAANAKEQEIQKSDPKAVVFQRDVMKDWMWKWFGKFCIGQWNRAQIHGNVRVQSFFGFMAPFVEYFFRPHIFFCSLSTLFKENIDRVIDTQIMGTSALLKAIRIYNWRKKKNVILEKVLVDLPTSKATHFFSTIKSLNDKDRKYFQLITIPPLLEENQTPEEFWQKHCNLTSNELKYEDYYVRQAFLQYRHRERKPEIMTLKTRYQSEEEWDLIAKTFRKGTIAFEKKKGEIFFSAAPNACVVTILLGSQPAGDSTLNYLKKFVEIAREVKTPIHLFIFCAHYKPKEQDLFHRVATFVQQIPNYPSNLTVIPMSFQKDDVLAPLFFRSDITCTRSGGQTAMELMCVSRGKIWVHSEAKKNEGELTEEELLKGIPGWESANATYLQHACGAKIVTPDTFGPLVYELCKI